ncbi:hypothetical protein BJ970_007278 [Saccharopolyspora phatthalungensis]|uniref:T6SS immunity protein Tdi1 C-terminal domain-containing protein n=1 Tax=Saccharopolyspora phatthalungensis TaxID=664693 RepID=A0A840QK28_9PSEU|nr:hypothetical protein [Saccharopolyspora phatthalungensis]
MAVCNGFYLFNAGLQVFRAGDEGLGPELARWNHPDTWKETYGKQAEGVFCFAQDLFGVQFAIIDNKQVVAFDPETAQRTPLGESMEEWAQWLLDDPQVRTAGPLATAWQDIHGALDHSNRLLPVQLFVLGGPYELANLRSVDAAEAMRIRGPLARQLRLASDGTIIDFHIGGNR